MKVIKPLLLGALHRTFEHNQTQYFVATVMAAFRLTKPKELVQEVLLWKLASDELGRDGVLELGMSKQFGEVLVSGRAYARGGPQPGVSVRVRIGPVDKTLYVVGDRHWELTGPSNPAPFTEMPVSWRNAFGGEKIPENPVGKGAQPIQVDGKEVQPLPNVEDPKHLIKSPKDKPRPVGFSPLDLLWPQRFAKLGTYDANWLKERYPAFATDLDWTIFNAAPQDQWLQGYFQGEESFSIEHMHPEIPVLEGQLPGFSGRAFIRQKKAPEALREIPTRLDTVHFFPHRDVGMLVFRGMVQVEEDDASDVTHLLVACEEAATPRSPEHYGMALERRLAKKGGALASLHDKDLIPAGQRSLGSLIDELRPDHEASEHLGSKNRRRGIERQYAVVRQQLLDRGLDPDKHLPPLPPPVELDKSVDELLGGRADLLAEVERANERLEADRVQKEEQARAALKSRGRDYDAMMADGRKRSAGPPELKAERQISEARAALEKGRADGAEMHRLEALLEKAAPLLRSAEAQLLAAYRKTAHLGVEPDSVDEEGSHNIRVRIELGAKEGVSFDRCDFTGADLRGLNAPGVNLSGAFLEGANLEGADLTGASLVQTVLARANLKGAKLTNVKAKGVNLGKASLEGADLSGAELERAILAGARLKRTILAGANLTRADFYETVIEESDLSGVTLPKVKFFKNTLSNTQFKGANLERALFFETNIRGADFSEAQLEKASFVTVQGEGAKFVGVKGHKFTVAQASNLDRADFSGAILTRANLRATSLVEANFAGARLDEADLSEADAPQSNFAAAYARKARFMKTNLDGADLSQIDLLGGSLMKATIRGAKLEGANLFSVDFARAVGDPQTSMKGANVKRVRVTPKRPDESG